MCTSNRDDHKLENTVKQSWFKHLRELHKEWTEAGVSVSRVTTLRHLQEKSYQTTSETETSSEASYLGCGEKDLDCCSVVQSPLFRWKYILHLIWKSRSVVWRKTKETQNPSCLKSSVKFPKSMMIWGAVTSAGVGPLHFIKSKVHAAVYQEILEYFILYTSSDVTLAPAHRAKPLPSGLLTLTLLCLIGLPTCLTWTPYWIYGIFSRERWETVDPTIQTSYRLNSASAEPQSDYFHDTPHWCWSLC